MTGYQEILTDPSYHEQIITMTCPMIGNVGVNAPDRESRKLFCAGLIVKGNCPEPSSWRSEQSLSEYLRAGGIVGLEGIDTRKLVRHLRTVGALRGIVSAGEASISVLKQKLDEYPGLVDRDIVRNVTAEKPYEWDKGVVDVLTGEERRPEKRFTVVAIDCGVKHNILRQLRSHGCAVKVVPAQTSAEDILAMKPDGVFLSNGPGDPDPIRYTIQTIRGLLGRVPLFGICLGQQLLGLALGGSRFKLKFGHRGANHPVKNLLTKKIEITSQNHGFCIDPDSLRDKDVQITHIHLNDHTLEGFRCTGVPAFSVQYHPEASPGPHDPQYLFDEFVHLMETGEYLTPATGPKKQVRSRE